MPIGSMKNKKALDKEKRKRSLLYVSKIMFFAGAVGLLVIAFLRFTAVTTPTVQ